MARGRVCSMLPLPTNIQCSSCRTPRSSACSAGNRRDRKYFSFADFAPFLKQIDEQGAQSDKLEAVQRSAFQSAILNLRNGLSLYQRLKNSVQPEGAENFAAELQGFESSVPGAAKAARERAMGENFDKSKLDDVAQMIQRYERLSEMAYLLAVPPVGLPGSAPPATGNGEWRSVGDSFAPVGRQR